MNGNGSTDLIMVIDGQITIVDFYALKDIKAPYLLSSYYDDLGNETTIGYLSNRENYNLENYNHRLPIAIQLVDETKDFVPTFTLSGFKKELRKWNKYSFDRGFYSFEENEFWGFKDTSLTTYFDSTGKQGRLDEFEFYTYEFDGNLQGVVKDQSTKDLNDGFVFSKTANDYTLFDHEEIVRPWNKGALVYTYERDGSSRTNSTVFQMNYDANGLLESKSETHLDKDGSKYRRIDTEYTNQVDNHWLNNLVSKVELIGFKSGLEIKLKGAKAEYLQDTSKLEYSYVLTESGYLQKEKNRI